MGRSRTVELLEDRLLRVVVRLLRVEKRHVFVPRVRGAFRERLLSSLASKSLGISDRPGVTPTLLDRRKASERRKIDARDELKSTLAWALSRALA